MITILLPAYKESENLKNILPKINSVLDGMDYEIIIIDTMEPTDDTEEVCSKNNAKYIRREGGNTYGDAIRSGFAASSGEFTIVMDADGSHDPGYILQFDDLMKTGEYDLIIGSRYCKGGHTDNGPLLRLMSWMLNTTYRILFGLKVKDVSDSFRMYKTEQIKELDLNSLNFDIVEEILIKLNLYNDNFRIREVPITFNKRDKGVSKRKTGEYIKTYLQTLFKMLRYKRSYKKQKKMEKDV